MKGFFLISSIFLAVIFPSMAHADYSPFITNFDQVGYFNYQVGGTGLGGEHGVKQSSGTINMGISGNPVYGQVTWHGFGPTYWNGNPEFGNPNVTFNGNNITGTALTESPGGDYGVGYRANVTSYLQQGNHNYTLGGVGFGSSAGSTNGINNGFGLTAVYEDASQSNYGRLIIASGGDYAHHSFGGNNGPNTKVLGFNIDSVNYDRQLTATLTFAGGQGPQTQYPDRRSFLWYNTGVGAIPMNLVDQAFATKYPENHMVLARDGSEWDTYQLVLNLPANSSYLAMQMESDDEIWNGESFSWTGAALFVPIRQNVIPEPATMMLFASGLGTLALRLRKKSAKS